MQAEPWTPNCQAGWNGGYHLQASTKLIIKCCMVEAGPHSLQASSLGCGQGQQCWKTEERCFYWQVWHLLDLQLQGSGSAEKEASAKSRSKLLLEPYKSCSAAEEPSVWDNAETMRGQNSVCVCARVCSCTCVLGWGSWNRECCLKLIQPVDINCMDSVPLPFQKNLPLCFRKD